ncbi:hypothetical protein E1B28_013200 [Marasmius oreades]|uniref:Cytochrome P450 n=1 Tax=Marasmius oreades TaxID=181124 RepID=A0A9P7RP86_9AGAR|nr:uncharacterized protein E1B28_013200 [Marasmius oreades]KAG7087219.1 hypothetical protein E1B28_013200 [Marasmius oreades]
MGKPIIILNSLEASIDLLEKRSNKYSNRPELTFAGEMIGWKRHMIMSPYGNRFRLLRKMVLQCGGTKSAVQRFQDAQRDESLRFVLAIAEDPEQLLRHLRRSIGAIYLLMSHGYHVERDRPDPLVGLVEKAAQDFYVSTRPGTWIVDVLPFLRHIPDLQAFRLPFQAAAAKFKETFDRQLDVPHQFVVEQMRTGKAIPSFSAYLLETVEKDEERQLIKYVSSTLYGGGLDTVVSSLGAFYLAMVMYPEVQRKVQEELDRVIGNSRLPDFSDRDNLPYLAAVQKEVMRWHPVGPMGIPHMSTAEDEYHGYYIPKGATVLSNLWKISRDPSLYRDPNVFIPERYLGLNPEQDPSSFVFGFGRRICPGQELAHATIYICIAMSMAVLDFTRCKDENGTDIVPNGEFLSGTVSHPKPFKCGIGIRSDDRYRIAHDSIDSLIRIDGDGDKLNL